jgi:histidyl-tRNA synthetase
MTEQKQFRAINGTRDILPPNSGLWNRVEQSAREVFSTYGFGEIRTPIFEETELFARSIGEDTDVIGKEMYTFSDRSENSISLRPEGTASVVRAYIQHKMHAWPQPVKLFYMGPMFRRERPQKGRYRQFYQIGAEVLGRSDETTVDSEVLEMLMRFFDKVGLRFTRLYINSIGDHACRPGYIQTLKQHLSNPNVFDRLGPDSQRRVETNPLRILDSKSPDEQAVIEQFPRITDHLCQDCRSKYEALKRELDDRNIEYFENWRLVRGLDYYERTTFEIIAAGLGSQNAVCGGGRYDRLVEMLGGHPAPGFGFAVGTDRLVLALQDQEQPSSPWTDKERSLLPVETQKPDVAIAGTSDETWAQASKLARDLRRNGLSVYLPKSGTKLQRVLETASKMNSPVVMIVGEDELRHGQYNVRVLKAFVEDGLRDVPVNADEIRLYGMIVKLRQGLERALSRLTSGTEAADPQRGLSRIVQKLETLGALPKEMAGGILDVLPTLNQAIHGRDLKAAQVQLALAYGNLLLSEIENLTPRED